MAFFQLTEEDYATERAVDVWPDNVEAINLFVSISTQWRAGPAGVFGLDYGVLFHRLDRMGLTPARYAELEEEIRTLEGAALDAIHEE